MNKEYDDENIEDFLYKEDYNKIPIHYCSSCLSLRVRILDDEIDYCDECGCSKIETSNIETWQAKYYEKYNKKFI